jgi:DGQHR domain-containing protein
MERIAKMNKNESLRLPAIEIQQTPTTKIYTCVVDGKELHKVASVSRVKRDEDGLKGYQRPEVMSHIDQIRRYIESKNPIIPNSLVVAFDSRVSFIPYNEVEYGATRHGWLDIPLETNRPAHEMPGWIVDGQQRAAAIREARVDFFPMVMTAFITDDASVQREQFILVNSTKPLPKSLIYELLPSTKAKLPLGLQRRRFPATLLEYLNFKESSPLYGRISTPTTPGGYIKDNSILKMLENSLTDGALYFFRDPNSGEGNLEPMLELLVSFWRAVAEVFPEEFDLPPRRSRLTHGAGITAMGFMMDAITDYQRLEGAFPPTQDDFARSLRVLAPHCHWTSGYWEFEPGTRRKWNEIQNLSRDIHALANYLLKVYQQEVLTTSL